MAQSQFQRSSDLSRAKRIWENYSYVFHLVSFLVLAVFLAGGWWSKAQEESSDVQSLKVRMEGQEKVSVQIMQSLNDIKFYLHIPESRESAGLQ